MNNSELRVVLMSATLNATLFSMYFGNSPMLNIPGFTYAVQGTDNHCVIHSSQSSTHCCSEYYLEDIPAILPKRPLNVLNVEEEIPYDLIHDLLVYICSNTHTSGAILCFLPGWDEISE